MKKTLLIVGTYVKDDDTEKLVKLALEPLVDEFDVCLVAHSPVSKQLQSMVKYFIYDHRNEIIPNSSDFSIWADYPSFYFKYAAGGTNHSYAIYRSYLNAVSLLENYYDDFIYLESDCIFSKSDIEKLKQLPYICNKENKDALFFRLDNLFCTIFFYSKMSFFREIFPTLKPSDEYITHCEKIGSWRALENFVLKNLEHKNAIGRIYDAGPYSEYFNSSQINITYFGMDPKNINKPPYESNIVCVENSEQIAFVYTFWGDVINVDMDVLMDGEKVYTIPKGPHTCAVKLEPKNENFIIQIGNWKPICYNKTQILNSKLNNFVRFK